MHSLRRFWAGAVTTVVSLHLSFVASAQISPITPSGLNTQTTTINLPDGKVQHNITGGTRPGNGPNLFHGFAEFGVPGNNIANFLNDSGRPTTNILGRVTSGNPSNILGTIQTTGFGNANLFLMNPAGIFFGPNASLNVSGSVHFTTADYLRLSDGVRFNALPNATADALLSTAPVAAFGFLASTPAAISVQGSGLSVTPGESISLVGGNITIQAGILEDGTSHGAHLSAPGGQIHLASVGSPGEILHPTLETGPNVNGQTFSSMGTITISGNSTLDASADAAGTVKIRSGQLVIDDSTVSADTGDTNGANVAIDVNVTGDITISNSTVPALTARTTGAGNAGEIRISSANMVARATPVEDLLTIIDSHTSGSGKGGNVDIHTTGNLDSIGDLTSNPFATVFFIDAGTIGLDGGRGGDIAISAKTVSLHSSQISAGGSVATNFLFEDAAGSAGNITISADTILLTQSFVTADSITAGSSGLITLRGHDIQMNDSALSSSGFEKSVGIQITADRLIVDATQFEVDNRHGPSEGIKITGRILEFKNGSAIASQTFGDNSAGAISVTASDRLTLSDDPTTFGAELRPTGLFTNSFGTSGRFGTGGGIIINTPLLEMNGGARIDTSTRSSGHGGDVTITAGVVSLTGERPTPGIDLVLFGLGGDLASGIFTRTVGRRFCAGACGDAGNVSVTTGALSISNGAEINSGTSSTGRGGDITINATGPISISGTLSDGAPSGIFSRAIGSAPGSGSGGTVNLQASQIILSDKAAVSASSSGSGNAGSVTLYTTQLTVLSGGQITTDTQQGPGNAGNITVQGREGAAFVDSILVSGVTSNISSSSEGSGNGGDISLQAGQVELSNGALVSANSTGTGKAGGISINAADRLVMNSSIVTTSTTHSDGGNIAIKAGSLVQLGSSEITTNVQGGAGSGGNITIDPPTVIVDHSKIIASAIGGNGGNINIVAGIFLVSPDSIIDASSQFGVSGIITIESPITNLSGTLAPLPGSFLRATGLVRGCAARLRGGQGSSLTVQTTRDRVPAEPGELSLGPLFARTDAGPVARSLDGVGALQAHFTFPLMDKCAS